MSKRKKWSELGAPSVDPEVDGVIARFLAGDIPNGRGAGRRYEFDGAKDATTPDGRRIRSRAHRHGGGVKRRGRGRS